MNANLTMNLKIIESVIPWKLIVTVLIVFSLVSCGSPPTKRVGVSGSNINSFPYNKWGSLNGRCKALGGWVAQLKNKYPDWKYTRWTRYHDSNDKLALLYLFEDDVFSPVFGARFEDLTDKQLTIIHDTFMFDRSKCSKLKSAEVDYALKFYGMRHLFSKSAKMVNNIKDAPNTYQMMIAHKKRDREYASRADSDSNDVDLFGVWSGVANCDGRNEIATLTMSGSNKRIYTGKISVAAGIKNMPVYLDHFGFDASDRPMFELTIEDKNGGTRSIGKTGVRIDNSGVKTLQVTAWGCRKFIVAQVPKIPESPRWNVLADRCFDVVSWLGRAHRTSSAMNTILYNYPLVVPSINLRSAYYHTLFSDHYKNSYGGTKISELSNSSLQTLLDSVELCKTYGGRKGQINEAIAGGRYVEDYGFQPFVTDVTVARSYNENAKFVAQRMEEIIALANATTEDNFSKISGLKKMLNEYAELVIRNPQDEYIQIFAALAERVQAAMRMKDFAIKNNLTSLPLAPLSEQASKRIRPDDERFKRGTDADKARLSTPITL